MVDEAADNIDIFEPDKEACSGNSSNLLNQTNIGLHNHWFNIEEINEFHDSDSNASDSEEDQENNLNDAY